MAEELPDRQWDIRSPREAVEIQVNEYGDTLWINVDGQCILRIQDIKVPLIFEQARRGSKKSNLNKLSREVGKKRRDSQKTTTDRDLTS